jgi:hypothetical protein
MNWAKDMFLQLSPLSEQPGSLLSKEVIPDIIPLLRHESQNQVAWENTDKTMMIPSVSASNLHLPQQIITTVQVPKQQAPPQQWFT